MACSLSRWTSVWAFSTATSAGWELVCANGGAAAYTTLTPRQQITATPYTSFAREAANPAGNLPAAQVTGTLPAALLLGADGGCLTNMNASDLATGTVPEGRLAANVARTNQVWLLGGNVGTTPGAHFLGTINTQALEFKVNGEGALRLVPDALSPNLESLETLLMTSTGKY